MGPGVIHDMTSVSLDIIPNEMVYLKGRIDCGKFKVLNVCDGKVAIKKDWWWREALVVNREDVITARDYNRYNSLWARIRRRFKSPERGGG